MTASPQVIGELIKRATAWMQDMKITDVARARKLLLGIIDMCPSWEDDLESIEIIVGGKRMKLDAAFRTKALNIMSGLKLIERGYKP